MPRNLFNIRQGEALIEDTEGSDLPDEAAARDYAVGAARSLLSAEVRQGRLPLGHVVEVTDEKAGRVLRVAFGESVMHV